MPPVISDVRYVADSEIRRLFNEGPYAQMIAEGRLRAQFLPNTHLDHPDKRGNPRCTFRQMIRYVDAEGDPVVEVFQYMRPDGTLGGSGRPDPKRLWVSRVVLIAEGQRPR